MAVGLSYYPRVEIFKKFTRIALMVYEVVFVKVILRVSELGRLAVAVIYSAADSTTLARPDAPLLQKLATPL